MGIEPTYSAWKADVLPLNHTCISVSLKGFEPPTLGLEGRCSIQLSYRLIYFVFRKQIGVTGFEPATPWSQTRYSSQTEPHPVDSFTQSRLSDTYSIIPKHYCNVKHFSKNFKKVLSLKIIPGRPYLKAFQGYPLFKIFMTSIRKQISQR